MSDEVPSTELSMMSKHCECKTRSTLNVLFCMQTKRVVIHESSSLHMPQEVIPGMASGWFTKQPGHKAVILIPNKTVKLFINFLILECKTAYRHCLRHGTHQGQPTKTHKLHKILIKMLLYLIILPYYYPTVSSYQRFKLWLHLFDQEDKYMISH
jgi:hypothetical protein